jgi:hypothetical protein
MRMIAKELMRDHERRNPPAKESPAPFFILEYRMNGVRLSTRRIRWIDLLGLLRCVGFLLVMSIWHDAVAQPPVTARDPQTVRIGVLQDGWPPFSIVQDGQVSGIGVDFLRAALRDRPCALSRPCMPICLPCWPPHAPTRWTW